MKNGKMYDDSDSSCAGGGGMEWMMTLNLCMMPFEENTRDKLYMWISEKSMQKRSCGG